MRPEKRFIKNLVFLAALGASALIVSSCGGEKEATTSAPAPSVGLTPTTEVAPTSVVGSLPEKGAFPSLGDRNTPSEVKNWPLYAPFELEGVRYGGLIRHNESSSVGNFDPKISVRQILREARFFYEKLLNWIPDENDIYIHLEPTLAENWKASADLKTYTYSIRKGVKWHNIPPVNGREFTAQDVLYSLNRYREPDSTLSHIYSNVESIGAPDDYTVVIKLKEASAWANNDLFGDWAFIVPKELVEQSGGTIKLNPIGTGPFVLKKYALRGGGTFVRNPNYWGRDAKGRQLPYLDEWQIIYITDEATTLAAARTGQLDVAVLRTDSVLNLLKTKQDVRVFGSGQPRGWGFAFNTTKPPWNDARVRNAFNMALDKQTLAEQAYLGYNVFWSGPVPWSYVSDKPFTFEDYGPNYKYNPSESRRLLIEAGFPDGKIKVPTPILNSSSPPSAVMQVSQQLWKVNSIEVTLGQTDLAGYSPSHQQRKYDDIIQVFQSTGDFSLNWFAQNKFKEDSLINTAFIRGEGVSGIVKEVKTTTDPARIRQLAKSLWDFDTSGSWNIWLPAEYGYFVAGANVRNIAVRTLAFGSGTGQALWPWLSDAPRTAP